MRLLLSIFLSVILTQGYSQNKYTQYVNPFIGTGGHGHTFPGATVPFGMVQLSPDTRRDGSWDGCSGYHYSDTLIYGFTHTHLSGTGCSDFGDILLMPTPYSPPINLKNYEEKYSHKNEKASAGYYKVTFDNGITTELTSTTRVGIHQYEFAKKTIPAIILDLTHRDETLESYVKIVGKRQIEGTRLSKAWATKQRIYYVAEFSEDFDWEIFLNEQSQKEFLLKDNYYSGKNVKAVFSFPGKEGKKITVKVGISNVSVDGARKNLEKEASHWDFEKYKNAAENEWETELSKIQVSDKNKNKLNVFYTALYHCMIHPSIANDVDGNYRGRDFKIHNAEGFNYYSVFSLWDTYRALHPLFTLIDKTRTEDFIKTFLAQYEQGGRLPVWELASNETDCMIGYHSVSVIADAYQKGIKGFDAEKALEAMKNSAMEDRLGLAAYKKNNMITVDDESESVSRTLEYAYDDWCIAQMAKSLGKENDYKTFIYRSQAWKNLFDKQITFFRPRKNGAWQNPFDPKQVNNNFTEGNSWQYSFYVPQDMETLIELHGGKKALEFKLDKLFSASTITTGRMQADITGLIGQYAHGNEPSHHIAYLYNYTGKYNKTVKLIDTICTNFYTNTPDGLIGNEDCGQMSAWYIFSSMGFYPVCPSSTDYILGKPQFSDVKLNLYNGKIISITKPVDYNFKNANGTQFSLNKSNFNELFISHQQLMNGGNLNFSASKEKSISDTLSKRFISPSSKIVDSLLVPAPIFKNTINIFNDTLKIVIISNNKKSKVLYRIVGEENFNTYKTSFIITKSCTIETYEQLGKSKSSIVKAQFFKRPNKWKVKLTNNYNSQYTAGGDLGLIDGVRGDVNWKKGNWQGYQPKDVEAIIELDKLMDIKSVKAGFLQDSRSWILFPTEFEIYTSVDGLNYNHVITYKNKKDPKEEDATIQELGGSTNVFNKQIKFVKIVAKNFGKLPEWHQGKGEDAFIFIDEILIE
jgi:predicted alpha-1,2-mannosidase